MSNNLPAGPPTWHRVLVATVAVALGVWTTKEFLRNYLFVTYTPFSEEEVERRQQENLKWKVKTLDTCTLEYTPEAKETLRQLVEAKKAKK